MQAKAILRHTPTSPRKMRLVAGLVRGKQVDQAKAILLNSTKSASRNVMVTLKSAVANYSQLNPDERVSDNELFVKAVFVDEGPSLKRTSARTDGSCIQDSQAFEPPDDHR
ncbi:ribosomal protein L22/L17 [Chlorobaculum parvum NCIB 8327]|uniref:50S ribosomal protein L22 n=1 Tax=Chlorobaculum parvum (strain DSM 263 / NCIMB 8327) TaxID=517417 RepID=B3QR85_CHLP8|nr:ribosomal protein L22/L17 [Chlorobaculum parvum NCIB 8327]